MSKKTVVTSSAPQAIGPYSQGITAGDFVFTSGQLPMNMATGELEINDIEAATRYALENVNAVLHAAGSDIARAVKVTVFLTDMNDFQAMNKVYADFFYDDPPSRSCVQVAALPKGVRIEIEALAIR